MPHAVGMTVAGWAAAATAGAATGTAIAATTAAFYVGSTLTYAAGMYLLNEATNALMPEAKSPGMDYGANYVDTQAPRKLIYGEVRVGGMHTIPAMSTGTEGKFLHFVLALAGHEVYQFGDFYFDDQVIVSADIGAVSGTANDGKVAGTGRFKDLAWLRGYKGTSTQTVDYILSQADPTVFTADFRGRGIAYAAVQLKWSGDQGGPYKTGVPNVTVKLKGKYLYDTRSSTTAWSANPALAARDFLVNEVGFATTEIDESLLNAAANVCDQSVAIPGGTQARYSCNLVLDADDDWERNLQRIVDCMSGRYVFRDGKWRIYAGAWEVPTGDNVIYTKDWVGPVQVQASAPVEERWNAVRCSYTDSARNYTTQECFPRRNTVYEAADGDRIWLQIDRPGCVTEYEAQRHGEFALRSSRNQLKMIGKLRPEFARLATWDTVTLYDDDYGFSAKTFRVATMDLDMRGNVDVVLAEEGSATWTDLLEADYSTITSRPTVDPGASFPGARASFTATAAAQSIDFAWTNPTDLMPGEMTRLIEYTSSGYAHLGAEVWRGAASRVNLGKSDTSTRYYWAQGIVGSYVGAYTPNTFGLPAAAAGGGAGTNGLSVLLTVPSVVVPSSNNGYVPDYAAANGAFQLLNGTLDVSTYAAFDVTSQAGLTGTVNSADNAPWSGQSKGRYRVTAVTSDVGVLHLSAVYSGTTYARQFVVTKSRAGYTGNPGPWGGNLLANPGMEDTNPNTGTILGWVTNGEVQNLYPSVGGGRDGGNSLVVNSAVEHYVYNAAYIPFDPYSEELAIGVNIRCSASSRAVYLGLVNYDVTKTYIPNQCSRLRHRFNVTSINVAGTSVCVQKPTSADLAFPGYASSYNYIVYQRPDTIGTTIANSYYDRPMTSRLITAISTAPSSHDILTLESGLGGNPGEFYLGLGDATFKYYDSAVPTYPNSIWREHAHLFDGVEHFSHRHASYLAEPYCVRWGTRFVRWVAIISAGSGDVHLDDAYVMKRARPVGEYGPSDRTLASGDLTFSDNTGGTNALGRGAWTNSPVCRFYPTGGPTGRGMLVFNVWTPGGVSMYDSMMFRMPV